MNTFLLLLHRYGTRALGVAQGTVALLCGMAGVIPASHLKWWLAASAVLTYWRGQTTSNPPDSPQQPTVKQ